MLRSSLVTHDLLYLPVFGLDRVIECMGPISGIQLYIFLIRHFSKLYKH